MRAIVLCLSLLTAGCAGSVFHYEPIVDTRKDAEGNLVIRDTPRMWAEWTRHIDSQVAREAAGGPPFAGVKTWETHWALAIKDNQQGRDNAQKYIDYVIEARRRAGLPELPSDTCALIRGIRALPFRSEQQGVDPRYDALMGPDVTTRLVADCITDTTPMPDPRQSPNRVDTFVAGDAAYMVFTRKSGIAFESLLPRVVSEKMARDGTDAYFEWVAQPGNRAQLAARAMASGTN
jgi:hypothetical protein